METNTVYYKSSSNMEEVDNDSIDLIVTSPPYYNIKDYSKDGGQILSHSEKREEDLGAIESYSDYIDALVPIWKECERVLKPNGKIAINSPLLPMKKKDLHTHYNRDIFDIHSDIHHSVLKNTGLYLMDLYIWNRTNSTKKLMFGSYPYPRNFYSQNTSEFIAVYVKDGKPVGSVSEERKEASKLTKEQWLEYTKHIWNIPIPNRFSIGYEKHAAIMPEEIVRRCVKLYTFVGDVVLDPFTGSGTTLKVAKEQGREYIGYELYSAYQEVIDLKLGKNGNK